MLQLRRTQKFAKDLQIKKLPEPIITTEPLNDWFIDVIRIARKKVAIIVHAKSLFPLLIPYSSASGAKNISKHIPNALIPLIPEKFSDQCIFDIMQLFEKPIYYCKTVNRNTLGHINDYKFQIEAQTYDMSFEQIDWRELLRSINDMPINVKSIGYTTATDLMSNLLRDCY